MVWRLVRAIAVVVLLLVAVAAIGLAWTHHVVQEARGPLPTMSQVLAVGDATDLPLKVSVIETARQVTPRSVVLDPNGDPTPNAPYVMTHPAFVVEWADGRLLLIDAGMSRTKAIQFGGPIEKLFGAAPLEPLTTVADALGGAASRIQGIVFTHLHIDHVDGIEALCARIGRRVKVFMTAPQLDTWTLPTAEGKRALEHAACAERTRIGGPALIPLDGFPGVAVIPAAGHTPGSQIVVVVTRDANDTRGRYLFAGDVTNTIDGVRGDVPKPFFYRTVIVPEDDDRLGELRRYLRTFEKEQEFTIVVSHDANHLKTLAIPAWGS